MWSLLSLLACREPNDPEARISFDPPSGPLSGYAPYTVDLSESGLDANEVAAVTLGAIHAWDLTAVDAHTLTLRDQGAPASGPTEVVLVLRDGSEHVFPGAFTYAPPLDPLFARVVAFGASLTQGVQAGVPVQHGVLHNPPHLVAQALGAYMPLPLLVDPLFPPLDWSDLGPPPDCVVPDVALHVTQAATAVLGILVDDETGLIDFTHARVDADLEVQDVAVGDTELHSMIYGPPDDPSELFVVKMVYSPHSAVTAPVATSQLELVEGLQPTLVLSTDPYANDVVQAILFSDGIDLSELTPPEEVKADLEVLIERLAATGAEVFLSNVPRPTVLPATAEKRAATLARAREEAISAGEDPVAAEAEAAAEIDAALATVVAAAEAHNANLAEVTSRYPQVHVVDFAARVDELEETGLVVAGETLTTGKLGGLLSTDGVHFGDVGYGVLAQLFVDTIAEATGVALPEVDLEALYPDDPYSPAAARAAGFDPSACGGW